jgi:hypothetical protein
MPRWLHRVSTLAFIALLSAPLHAEEIVEMGDLLLVRG